MIYFVKVSTIKLRLLQTSCIILLFAVVILLVVLGGYIRENHSLQRRITKIERTQVINDSINQNR